MKGQNLILREGLKLVVQEPGSDCPLLRGEVVTVGAHWVIDFLGGGDIVAFEVKRSSRYRPSKVLIERGSRGARFSVPEFSPGRRGV